MNPVTTIVFLAAVGTACGACLPDSKFDAETGAPCGVEPSSTSGGIFIDEITSNLMIESPEGKETVVDGIKVVAALQKCESNAATLTTDHVQLEQRVRQLEELVRSLRQDFNIVDDFVDFINTTSTTTTTTSKTTTTTSKTTTTISKTTTTATTTTETTIATTTLTTLKPVGGGLKRITIPNSGGTTAIIAIAGNQVLLDKMQSDASSSPAAMRTFAYDVLGVSFTPHVGSFTTTQSDVGFFGFGCGSSTWQWHSDFAKKLTGCNVGTVGFHLNSRMTCTSSGYNSGSFSGPRICACK